MDTPPASDASPCPTGGWRPWLVWGFGPMVFFYAWFQRVAPSIMIDPLMRDLGVSALVLGNLSAVYFYAYAGLQLPVGVLVDRFGPRRLLSCGLAVCALGTTVFALATDIGAAYLGRLLIGGGAAFGFVGGLKLATTWLAPRHFALASGLLMMSGMLGGILGQAPLAAVVEVTGWRPALLASAAAGLALAAATWWVVRDAPGATPPGHGSGAVGLRPLLRAVLDRQNLLLALVLGAMTAPLLGFAGLWGVAWLMQVHGMSRPEAAGFASLLLLGWAAGSPLAGAVGEGLGRRKHQLMAAVTLGGAGLGVVLWLPSPPPLLLGALFVLCGACFGTMVLGFAIARDSNPPAAQGAAFGFLNAAVVGSGAVFQPLVGWILDLGWNGALLDGAPVYDAGTYRAAFASLLVFLAVGLAAAAALHERPSPAPT
jgi:MFS family permease